MSQPHLQNLNLPGSSKKVNQSISRRLDTAFILIQLFSTNSICLPNSTKNFPPTNKPSLLCKY